MSQDWTANLYTQATEGDTTLSNMELMFATLKSLFSGASAPANTVAYMPWGDSTKKVVKRRDHGDSAWFGVMHGDVNQKIWVYRDSAMEGWAVDSSVTDTVLAVKGGSTYTTGAATAGSWTISGLSHNHQWYEYTTDGGDDYTWQSDGSTTRTIYATGTRTTGFSAISALTNWSGDITNQNLRVDCYTKNNTVNDSTYRPAAAVGTLQYLDL